MTNRPLLESEGQEPLRVGEAQIGASLSPAEVSDLVRRRLEQLVGGVLLSENDIACLSRRLTVRQYAAGETIINKGIHGDFLGVVAQGEVAVHSASVELSPGAAGHDGPAVFLLPGSTFGEAMLIDGRRSGSTLRAVSDTELYVLRRADFLTAAEQRSSQPAYGMVSQRPWLAAASLVFLFAAIAVGIYFGLNLISNRTPESGEAAVQVSEDVRIVEPSDGGVAQGSSPLKVRAVLEEPGFSEADLQVDGTGLGVVVNSNPEAVPWVVEWSWEEVIEGAHVLAVQARGPKGEWVVSVPVTVTVVPAGRLAFASNRDGARAIYTMGTHGRDINRLATGPGDVRQPAWHSSGTLAYVAETQPGQTVVRWTAGSVDGETDLLHGWDPAWSPDGTRLAYTGSLENVSQVFTVAVAGGTPFQVTAELAYAGQPAWSPDGARLAYVAEQEGNWDIWIVELDGTDPRRLTADPARDWAPVWSPDGKWLAFVSNRGGTHQIYVMRTDGSGVRLLTEFARGAEAPVWSPDGHWLALVAYTGDGDGVNAREIYLMRADGRDQLRLTHNTFDDTQPDWGPAP